MKKVYEALHWASSFLGENGRDQNIGELLLMHHLGLSRAQLLAAMQDEMPTDIVERFRFEVSEHSAKGVPVQHMIGVAPFYGREFSVNGNVLIPRPETEELIENALKIIQMDYDKNKKLTIADIGVGSGIIAVTMQLEFPDARVFAVDISTTALEVAQRNATKLGAGQIEFLQGNLLDPLIENGILIDVLLSNPPYIPLSDMETLNDVVLNHDPHLALFGGQSGLEFYEEIVKGLPKVLNDRAIVGFEIGDGQGLAISGLLKKIYPKEPITVINDINGKERMVFIRINNQK